MTYSAVSLRTPDSVMDFFREELKSDRISSEPEELQEYETATFHTSQRVLGILRPESVEEVACVTRIANQQKIPLYPVSGGRNWGLGSRVPTSDGCVVVDLSRLNRIREFREDLGYVVIEAGVTFAQLFEYLQAQGSDLFLAAIGGPPEASIIGNALERGDGVGPYGDRASQVTSLEVVLPAGKILYTGFSAFCDSTSAHISRHAPGPDLEALFFQSNFGVVTSATVWLRRKPKNYQAILFTLDDDSRFDDVMTGLRSLQEQGVIKPNSFALWNPYKFLAGQGTCPWNKLLGQPLSDSMLRPFFPKFWRKTKWLGFVALYSAGKLHGMAERRLVTQALRGKVQRKIVLNAGTAALLKNLAPLIKAVSGFDPRPIVHSFFTYPVALGVPTRMNTASMYWRKPSRPAEMDPHRDRCGLYWMCHILPFDSSSIAEVGGLTSSICFQAGFEPNIAFLNYSERCLRLFALISYDRDRPDEDERAFVAAEKVHTALTEHGYPAYRLGISFMDKMSTECAAYSAMLGALKSVVDPSNILAPGRYVVGAAGSKETFFK